MKICKGCKFNLDNQILAFETGLSRMHRSVCSNREILEDRFIFNDCLQLLAGHLISFSMYMNGHDFSDLPDQPERSKREDSRNGDAVL